MFKSCQISSTLKNKQQAAVYQLEYFRNFIMWQFSREGIFACRNICSILISAEALSMTCATRLLPSSPFNSEWNPALSLIRALYFPTCWPLCSIVWRSRDCKILILFLAMMNLIGDIWVYQLVNDQLTKETNNGWWFYLLKKVEDLFLMVAGLK